MAAAAWIFVQLADWEARRATDTRGVVALKSKSPEASLGQVRLRIQRSAHLASDDATELVDQILYGATKLHASDVHLTPGEPGFVVTCRVDGQILTLASFSVELGRLVTNRIKILASLRLDARTLPQDGRIGRVLADLKIDVRVSVLPTAAGERIALRLVPSASAFATLPELGFEPELVDALQRLLARPQGLLFVTGPVGSGKSTTLYSSLLHIHETRGQRTALVTLEDPIEKKLAFLAQTPVNQRGGLTFADSLRSVLRQDPNVLMVGEIRDRETAEIAAQAGLTGHLILTTVHAPDALGAFTRLLELGGSASALSSAAVGSLSQRLVRCLCADCRHTVRVSAAQREQLLRLDLNLPEDALFYEASGCPACNGDGFLGRRPIAELVVVDSSVRDFISGTLQAKSVLHGQKLSGLLRSGIRSAAAGFTSVDEILRVCT